MMQRIDLPQRKKHHNALRLAAVSLSAVLIVGCSLVQLAYNNLTWVIPWYVDDYITLNRRQASLLEDLIQRELHWHRTTQLPAYAQWFRALSGDVKAGFTHAKVNRHLERFEEFRKALMQETATHLATLLVTTSDAQIAELFDNFDGYNRRFSNEYIDRPPDELQQNRLERVEGIFADWLGPLTKTQRAAIDHWSRQRGSIAPEVLAYRKQWQTRFHEVLEQRAHNGQFTEELRSLLVTPHRYSPPTYLEKRQRNIELGKELFLAIVNDATPAQRERLRETLKKYARDFEQLSLQT